MTPETSKQQNLNSSTVSLYSGLKDKKEFSDNVKECKICGSIPEDQGHRCIDCADEISRDICMLLDGRCKECDWKFIYSLRH